MIGSCPTAVVYASASGSVTCRGGSGPSEEDQALAWIQSMGLVAAPPLPVSGGDLGLVRTAYDGGYPSSQQAAPTPPAAPPEPAPGTQSTPMIPAPMVPMMAQAPASVIQVPGPNLVVQQGQPNVYVTQAAASYSLAAPAAAPSAGEHVPARPRRPR